MFLDKLYEVPPPPVDPVVAHRRRRKKKRITWWVISVAMLVVVGGAAAWWFSGHHEIRAAFHLKKNTNANTADTTAMLSNTTNATNITNTTNVPVSSFTDSDNDGLTDEVEALYGSDPNNSDTDGDGFQDGMEIGNGYDPLNPKMNVRMVDLALTATIAKGDPATTIVSSGMSSSDRLRYYLLYDGTSTSYYATDGTLKAQCPVNAEQSGICATLPNEIRTDFSRTFDNGTSSDAYHVPF